MKYRVPEQQMLLVQVMLVAYVVLVVYVVVVVQVMLLVQVMQLVYVILQLAFPGTMECWAMPLQLKVMLALLVAVVVFVT